MKIKWQQPMTIEGDLELHRPYLDKQSLGHGDVLQGLAEGKYNFKEHGRTTVEVYDKDQRVASIGSIKVVETPVFPAPQKLDKLQK